MYVVSSRPLKKKEKKKKKKVDLGLKKTGLKRLRFSIKA